MKPDTPRAISEKYPLPKKRGRLRDKMLKQRIKAAEAAIRKLGGFIDECNRTIHGQAEPEESREKTKRAELLARLASAKGKAGAGDSGELLPEPQSFGAP